MKRPLRRAFTLVELLVVIAIIAILVGAMMPGIMAMREASRRSNCLGKLLKIGLALGKYQAAEGSLPAGVTDTAGPIHNVPKGLHTSWTVRLLPYLDELGTYKDISLDASVYDRLNANVRKMRIPALVCPSDHLVAPGDVPASSYAGCHNGVEAPIDVKNTGVLYLNSHITDRDVVDGLEHTIFVGEKITLPGDLGWMSGTRATLRNTGTPLNQTDEPPKSDLVVGGFSSCHPAGANFLFGDQSFRFVSDAIDQKVLEQLGNRDDGNLLTSGPTRDD